MSADKSFKTGCPDIVQEIGTIRVEAGNEWHNNVFVQNPTPFPLIGEGIHGAVFQINEDICVKVHAKETEWRNEVEGYNKGKTYGLLPEVYHVEKCFIVMELLKGVSLKDYLDSEPLTKELSRELLKALRSLKNMGVREVDQHLHHFIRQMDGRIRMIDLVENNMYCPSFPQKLLREMQADHRKLFLRHVGELDAGLLARWTAAPDWPYR